MVKLLNPLDRIVRIPHQLEVVDDFEWFVTAHRWTSLAADSGASVAVGDAVNGVVALTTGGTNNNEALLRTTAELFKFQANKPFVGEMRFQYAEANTDDANIFIGFADAMGADLMVDDGAGPKASFSGAGFYKVDGGTRWQVISSVGTTRTADDTVHTAGGSGYVTVRIEWLPENATTGEVVFLIDPAGGQNLQPARYYTEANRRLNVIRHTVTFASATEMHFGAYVKAGGANSEVLNVDVAGFAQSR